MEHNTYGDGKPTVAILIKRPAHKAQQMRENYLDVLSTRGFPTANIITIPLSYDTPKKVSADTRKSFLNDLRGYLDIWGIDTLYVADAEYFKTIQGVAKTEDSLGYVKKGKYAGYEDINVILGINYQASIYNPTAKAKLSRSLDTLLTHLGGTFVEPGKDIIHAAWYPNALSDIQRTLTALLNKPELTIDIEGRSLNFWECGLESIAFAWNKHEGVSFVIDRLPMVREIRKMLARFFICYQGKAIWHNAGFDLKVLTYELFMSSLDDYDGMNQGISILTRNVEDTKLIAFLATNSTSEVPLGLKPLSAEYTGNYGLEDIENVAGMPTKDVVKYNLTDCLATWYVYEKYYPRMVADEQEAVYRGTFLPSMETLLQTELVGMPICPIEVNKVKVELTGIADGHMAAIMAHPDIDEFWYQYLETMAEKDNAKRLKKSITKKIKIKTGADFDLKFNPGSPIQLQSLLYDYLELPVIDRTKTKAPATGAETLDKLQHHCANDVDRELLEHFVGLAKAQKILSSFIPAFEKAVQLPDGSYRLFGNFNLGGTQSGRLSSSNPNLQNIPSGSLYAKLIKRCFKAPKGWIFCGADYNALEARVNALLTKDPEKIKIYVQGYDSHCFNTYVYFKAQMPDIVDTVESINTIEKLYKPLRSKSKKPTFALQYFGTHRTIMNSTGLPEAEAIMIEANYLKTFHVSMEWINAVLDEAHTTGYISLAFGLRLRTPALAQTLLDVKMPYAAVAERRSAGNAKSQSYGMLNSRSANECRDRTLASEFSTQILPCAQIHDAAYYICRDNLAAVKWLNDNLIECMQWQELPEIQHDEVKLGGALDIFWPDWTADLTIPNGATEDEIRKLSKEQYDANSTQPG